jgi:Bacterial Ig-like domain
MTIPAYFTTSPINSGSPITLNVPPVGGIIYDFIGANGLRITAFVNGSAMPSFTSSGGSSQLLDSSPVTAQLITALGGGIQQLAVRLTVNDGDSDASGFDFNEAFLNINGVSQMLNTSVMDTFNHDSNGDATSASLTPGYPDGVLATGWGLVTDATILSNVYNSLVSTNKIDLFWESVAGGGGNVLNFGSGLNADYLSQVTYPSIDPTAQVTLNLQSGIDNGASAIDLITSNNILALEGNAFPGQVLEIYDGATLIDTVTTNASAFWSYTFTTALPDAVHNLVVKAVDGTGNVTGTSNALNVTIDTVALAPSLPDMTAATDTGPSNSDNITGNRRPTFTGTAEANSSVRLYDGTTLLTTVTADGTGAWTYTPASDLVNGVYNYKVQFTDLAGNVSPDSGILTFTVNDTGLPLTAALQPGSDNGVSTTDLITSNPLPGLQGKALPNETLQIFDGATLVTTVNSDASGDWNYTFTTGLPDGVHNLVVKSVDGSGNITATAPTIALTVDTVALAPSLPDMTAATDTGPSDSDNVTNNRRPTFTGTAEADSTVRLYDGTTLLATVTADGAGDWTYTPSADLADGSYAYKAQITDLAGNVSPDSGVLNFLVNDTGIQPVEPTPPALDGSGGLEMATRV